MQEEEEEAVAAEEPQPEEEVAAEEPQPEEEVHILPLRIHKILQCPAGLPVQLVRLNLTTI